MSPLTIETIEQDLKPARIESSSVNPYFLQLMKNNPPELIEDQSTHKRYTVLLEKLSLLLVRYKKQTMSDAQTKQVIEGLSKYAKLIAELVEHYEKDLFPPEDDPVGILEFLMEQHGLTQGDLKKELGGQSVVSAVLSRKRKLNSNHIARLAARFKVSPSVFFNSVK